MATKVVQVSSKKDIPCHHFGFWKQECDVARYSYTAAVPALGLFGLKVSRKSLMSAQQSGSVLLSSCCWPGCFAAGSRGGLLWP